MVKHNCYLLSSGWKILLLPILLGMVTNSNGIMGQMTRRINFECSYNLLIQIQHPRTQLNRFDLVVTPRHDYYALTASGQNEIPRFFRRWVTPQEPPGPNVVHFSHFMYRITN